MANFGIDYYDLLESKPNKSLLYKSESRLYFIKMEFFCEKYHLISKIKNQFCVCDPKFKGNLILKFILNQSIYITNKSYVLKESLF